MTLQKIVNQTWYTARKATFGAVLGFSLVSAPKLAYGIGEIISPSPLFSPPLINVVRPIDPMPPSPPPGYGDPVPIPIHSSIWNRLPQAQRNLVLKSQEEQQNMINHLRFGDEEEKAAKLEELAAKLAELFHFPSLDELQQKYPRTEHHISPGSVVYKAREPNGYYVHYPQMHRIYYVERRDKKTIPYSIADENGTVLFRANEKGEMESIESRVEAASSENNTLQHPTENETRQPLAADVGVFQNMFDCASKLELYSATGTGVGSLAVLGPVAAALWIRRRRKSHLK